MNKERAIEVIENLRDYAFENWEDDTYSDELDEIGEAVDLIKDELMANRSVGMAEIEGKKYLVSKIDSDLK